MNPHWAKLGQAERLILVTMAHTALDKPSQGRPAGIYWAGHEYLMIVLIGHQPPRGSSEYLAAQKRIQRSIRKLIDAGAIEKIKAAQGRHRTRYRVHIDNFNQPPLPEDDDL